ncbi:hypothetical protein HETIRDRAFT_456223 [Heterobasidion irregulare TC 32-1]|uniref:Uncharacterized protein n=1 Tax=Heterobasidion irregulare (strain TC 32-1) TaxID=747525 RepID=W4JM97_HETIT|nr:uncharacterized protein HETIRDRAFT_456223 [Heterobasidion irregulare TC 32-1]ETW74653.1 hypothetical protein HETIRDRAFT_456223 [Heterobasidion irregulare TC 32-1]
MAEAQTMVAPVRVSALEAMRVERSRGRRGARYSLHWSAHHRITRTMLPCQCVLTTSPVHGADHRWSACPHSASTLLTHDQPEGDDGAIGTNIRYLPSVPGTPAQLHFEALMRSPASSDADPIPSDPRVSPPVSPHAVGHRRSLSAPPRIGGASRDKQTEIARNSGGITSQFDLI